MRCEKLNESALLRTLQRGASGEAAAGGGVDVMGRAFLEGLSPLLHQQFVVVNRDGAGGVLGFTQLAQARAEIGRAHV